MEGCYLTTLPKGAMRALAGFSSEGGSFSLKRAVTPVPEGLTSQIFPSVLRWSDPATIEGIAGESFVKLILSLRNVVLQDGAVLRAKYPKHPMWNHAVFRSSTFTTYAAAVLQVCESPEEHVVDSVRRAMPVMTNVIQSSFSALGDRLSHLETGMGRIEGHLSTIVEKGFKMVINDDVITSSSVQQECYGTSTVSVNPTPTYSLSRSLQTVTEVWQEYSVGINGGPAVQVLEDTYGTSWRQLEPERRYYSRRKVFYSAIDEIATHRAVPHAEAVAALESERKKLRKSLDGMMKHIKACGPLQVYEDHIRAINT
jgi:hypothetical protein